MKTYDISRLPSMLCIGYDGENNWRPQAFDVSSLLANHPNGTITLWLLPDGETQAFPVALTRGGNTVVWTPLSEEMTARTGALQIVCTDGTDVGKSRVTLFRVDSSILPGADHPAAVPSWATQTIERAEAAADRAEEAAESIDIEALEARIAQAVEDYLEEHPVSVTVDSVLSSASENPVQNKVVKAALDAKTETVVVTIDNTTDPATASLNATQIQQALQSGKRVVSTVETVQIPLLGITENTAVFTGVLDTNYIAVLVNTTGNALFEVIPLALQSNIPQMATQADMSDWTQGKTVDAAVLKTDFQSAAQSLDNIGNSVDLLERALESKADIADIPTKTSDLTNDSGFQTAAQVQTYVQQQIAAIPDELPTVTASDNGKFLRVVSGAWAAATVPAAESNSFGGGA